MSEDVTLTSRQQQILDFIKKQLKESGYPPSVREIGQAVGLKSSSTVHAHLVHLENMGLLKKDPSKPRTLIPIEEQPDLSMVSDTVYLPVVGAVAAGTPILAEQNIDGHMPVPGEFIKSGTSFILKVKGESMIEAGILDGDYIIVREQPDANNGDIVVAMLEDEATVKRIYKHPDHIELIPENSTMQPIITSEAHIIGKVLGLMRRM
ncbi:MAG TPA: transcriptional repressor LexA [Syntrophomonadaceae bacterium]|jgi:repressor LexA|nr:transcriptional repressor LexA [Syntrophomonadaceae bacterium]HRX21075.1 transcriptional repressor LexA [Syntrophomonadaceae bacterium]